MDTRPIRKIFIKTLLLLCCLVLSPAAWSQQLENSLRRTNLAPEILRAMIPEKQQTIMNALADFATQYKASPNSVKKYLLRQKRQKFLAENCRLYTAKESIPRVFELVVVYRPMSSNLNLPLLVSPPRPRVMAEPELDIYLNIDAARPDPLKQTARSPGTVKAVV